MICKNCQNEINEGQKFCTNCGTKVNEPIFKKWLVKNKIIMSIIALIILGAITCFGIYGIGNAISYNLIRPLDNASSTDVLLDTLIKQDDYLRKYAQLKENSAENDKYFEIFYRNLIAFTGRETELSSKLSFDSYEHKEKIFNVDNIEISTIDKNDYIEYIITKPITELVKLAYSGEGYWSAEINYNYLVSAYPSYLSEDWQAFLKIKQKEYQAKKGNSYYIDGAITPSKDELANWLIDETSFLNKYPNFALKDIMKKDLSKYVADFKEDIYQTFTSDDYPILTKKAKIAYEKYLKQAEQNTEEYKQIKEWYELLKKDGFKQGLNYFKYKYDETGNEYFLEEYNKLQAEE